MSKKLIYLTHCCVPCNTYSSFIRPNRQRDEEHTKIMMKVRDTNKKIMMKVRDSSALNMHSKSVTHGFLLCKYTVNRMDAVKFINREQFHLKILFIHLAMYTNSIKSV